MIILLISAIISVAMFFAPLRFSRAYLYWLIPINVLADSMVGFFGEGETHTGMIRAGLVYPYLLLSLIRLKPQRDHLILFGFIGYLLCLVMVSSNLQYSFWQLLKVSTGFLMYPLAFVYIRTNEDFDKLMKSLLTGCALIIANFILAQIFKIGESPYFGGLIYVGAGLVQITYVVAYMLIMSPFLMETREVIRKRFTYLILGGGLIQLLLTFRRSSLLAVLAGTFAMALTTSYRKQVFKVMAIAVVVLGLFYTQKAEMVDEMIEKRLNIEAELTSRGGRVHEFSHVAKPFKEGNLKRIMIGEEIFNTINLREFVVGNGKGRPLHVDFNILLHGSGMIGLLWYLYFHLRIWRYNRKLNSLLPAKEYKKHAAAFTGLMAAHLIISLSNQFFVLTSLSTIFLLFGGLNSVRFNQLEKVKSSQA